MRKPDICMCEKKAFVFATRIVQISLYLYPKFKILAFFFDSHGKGRFVLATIGNPEDRFSHVAAHLSKSLRTDINKRISACYISYSPSTHEDVFRDDFIFR